MWPKPLLAPVSTVGKTRLVVVAVQGAPSVWLFFPFEHLSQHDQFLERDAVTVLQYVLIVLHSVDSNERLMRLLLCPNPCCPP